MATIRANSDFSAEAACEKLRAAMRGAGTDEEAIIDVLTTHDNEQRQEIKSTFKTMYGMDLVEEIKSEISSSFEKVALGLLQSTADFLAKQLRKAMDGAGTNEDTLIEILCTRKNEEIDDIKKAYKQMYDRDLEGDIHSETSDDFRRLLVSQVNAARSQDSDVDRELARQDVEKIWEAGEAALGTDESTFNMVLCQRSFEQLRHTFAVYKEVTDRDIEESIQAEMSGDLETGLLALVRSIKGRATYYANRLHKAMKGLGTDDTTLIRIIVSRSEIDLDHIKEVFAELYGQSLTRWIKDDTSGDYEKLLVRVLKEDD